MGSPDPLGHAVEQMTGEPILGPRQAALIDAVVARLTSGFPLSQPDLAAYFQTAVFLRLATPNPTAVPATAAPERTATA